MIFDLVGDWLTRGRVGDKAANWDEPRRWPSRTNILLQVSRNRSNVDVSLAWWLLFHGATVTVLEIDTQISELMLKFYCFN